MMYDPKPKPKPVKPSPFVTDTLFKLLGPFVIDELPGGPHVSPKKGGQQILAQTLPDTIRSFGPLADSTLMHEAGHLADLRGVASEARLQAGLKRPLYPGSLDDYFGADPNEYVAEAFRQALESSRRGFIDSTARERNFPGAMDFIRWMRPRPPFAALQGAAAPAAPVASPLVQLLTGKPQP